MPRTGADTADQPGSGENESLIKKSKKKSSGSAGSKSSKKKSSKKSSKAHDEENPAPASSSTGDADADTSTGVSEGGEGSKVSQLLQSLKGVQCCLPTGPIFQWGGLFIIAFITFGTSVAYDSVGALGPAIRRKYHINAEGLADLYSVYHLPNLILVFFGGLLGDRIGTRKASLLFSSLVLFGVFLVAIGDGLVVMMIGRFIFGMGSESLSVIQLGILARWYSKTATPPSLGIACALSLTINRMGTLLAFDYLPTIGAARGMMADVSEALMAVFWIAVACFCANLIYCKMDADLEPHLIASGALDVPPTEPAPKAADEYGRSATATYGHADHREDFTFHGVLNNMSHFSTSYWLIVVVCICHYAVMITYSDFAADFFHEQYGYDPVKASRVQSVTTMIGLLCTPVAGFFADKYGHRVHMMLGGSALLVPAHILVSVLHMPPIFSSVLQGIASALVCSALWPAVALVLPSYLVNTAVGLMTALQNTALFTVPLVIGGIRVRSGRYTAGIFLYLGLDALAVLASWRLLRRTDSNGMNVLQMTAEEINLYGKGDHLDDDDATLPDKKEAL